MVGGWLEGGECITYCAMRKGLIKNWIPYSNYSQSNRDGWFVFSYSHVPTKNAKSLKPLLAEFDHTHPQSNIVEGIQVRVDSILQL